MMRRCMAALLLGLIAVPASANVAKHHHRHASSVAAPADAAPLPIPLAPGAREMISHGRFDGVALYPAQGKLKSFAFVLSGADGWQAPEVAIAQQLSARGAIVAGIDTQRLYKTLEAADDDCLFLDGDFENLGRYIEAYEKVPGYLPPILVGRDRGSTLAYMLDAQGPVGTFTGAISLGFCPQTGLHRPFCEADGLRYTTGAVMPPPAGQSLRLPKQPGVLAPSSKLSAPWTWIDAGAPAEACPMAIDPGFPNLKEARRIVSAPSNRDRLYLKQYDALAASLAPTLAAAEPPASLADLPLIELPNATPGDTFAVLWSGDGGWAGLDKDVGEALKKHGIPVVGVDSLRYFWGKRTPGVLAADVDRIVRFYANRWHRSRVLLIGYSQGANVLPFAYNRLPETTRKMVVETALMGLESQADFEFHVTNWVGNSKGLPIAPEMQKLGGTNALCFYGVEEDDSLCPSLDPKRITLIKLPGGHHFDGNYEHLAQLILQAAGIKVPT
ncbi:virulence factor family protein [Solimonas marina]|uniref:Virulence factor family protein n=1 Tax=Solimonas marina TaxID=2714601 RepID=A0A969WG37_9GAMM|nr:virulence factor family protein [Solimonas marina]NKF24661.1 virulence factor family protein [Solimonas marina]